MNPTAPSDVPGPLLAEVVDAGPVEVAAPSQDQDPRSLVPPAAPGRWRTLAGRLWRGGWSGVEWLFGAATLTVGLAVLAAIPVVQFLSLGYLLEASGRIARSGRLRDGFLGVRQAARVGSMVLGIWLMLLPLRLLADLAESAALIDPGGPVAAAWRFVLLVLTCLMFLHLVVAIGRGGRLRHFLWPFTNPIWLVRRLARGGWYAEGRDAVWDFAVSLRLPYYFWLGLRGFAGGLLWLFVPVTLIAASRHNPGLAVLWLPLFFLILHAVLFLQTRFATENRFRAFFEIGPICEWYLRAPWAFAVALTATLLFAVPLYLLKIEAIPREAEWLPGLLFISFIFPARLLTGWACGRARRRPRRCHAFFCLTAPLLMTPAVAFYMLIVFFSQYTAWKGIASLYEQHAFLLPVPLIGM